MTRTVHDDDDDDDDNDDNDHHHHHHHFTVNLTINLQLVSRSSQDTSYAHGTQTTYLEALGPLFLLLLWPSSELQDLFSVWNSPSPVPATAEPPPQSSTHIAVIILSVTHSLQIPHT
jgi:hypothetical protein